ncbi:hypothetical protein GW17_00061096 [Ensete ventricosum]|nr:hypothetical protein GW17_00061096 [Ensete ventricosum]
MHPIRRRWRWRWRCDWESLLPMAIDSRRRPLESGSQITLTFKELMPEEFRTHAKRQLTSPQELNYSTNSCLSSVADAERCIKQRFVLVVDATREEEEIRCSMEREGRRNTAACFYRCQTGESKRVSEVESEKVKTARVARPGLNQ